MQFKHKIFHFNFLSCIVITVGVAVEPPRPIGVAEGRNKKVSARMPLVGAANNDGCFSIAAKAAADAAGI